MSRRYMTSMIAFVMIVLLTPTAHGIDDTCVKERVATYDGSCWKGLTAAEKRSVILGFWAGQRGTEVRDDLAGVAKNDPLRDWLGVPARTMSSDIIEYFDLLYKTPANRGIQWDWAYILAAMSARDDDTDDRLSLIKSLRDHDSIPTQGHIVDVKGPNLITIESRQGTFDIHLEGVSSEGMSDAQKRRALDFLHALSRGDSKLLAMLNKRNLCDNSDGLPISLVYETQFFQDGKTLSALVRIGTYTHICLKDGSVAVDTLDPNGVVTFGNDLSLNHLLVASGLALVDEDVDPRWPEPIVDARNLYLETIHDPKTAGDNKFPAIDDVIAHSSELN